MVAWASAMFRLCTFCLLIPAAVSFHSSVCRDLLTPMFKANETMRRTSETTLFRLAVTKHHSNTSHGGSELYKVEIVATNSLVGLTNAQIAVVKTESCGFGELSFTRTDFNKEAPASSLCPLMLITNSDGEKSMQRSPHFLWKPPSCGCVQFRALAFEDEKGFYVDDGNVDNGPLTKTVCVRKREDRQVYTNALCRVRARYSVAEIVNRDAFKIRHGLRDAAMDKRSLVAVYEARLERIARCCSEETNHQQMRCLDRTRFHRVDRLCEDGIPDLAFTALRRAHTRSRERKCCFIMGSHRYTCFNHRSGFPANSTEPGILDYSLDETDPVNDLSDIATPQDGDILSMLSRLEFDARFFESESVNMRDIGSKSISSEERSSRVSLERSDSRGAFPYASSEALIASPISGPKLPDDEGIISTKKRTKAANLPRVPAESSIPVSRMPGKSSRGKGRGRGRNSWRRRNSGHRRRSGRASRESRRRGKARRRSGSRERKWKGMPRTSAEQSRSVELSRATSYRGSSMKEIRRFNKKEERNRLRITCCSQGSQFGIKLSKHEDERFIERCEVEAGTREEVILGFQSKRMANICWISYKYCCENAYLSDVKMTSRETRGRVRSSHHTNDKVQRDEAEEMSDERGEDLDLGKGMDETDKESEKRYQNMRASQQLRDDDEDEKDGPARHDEVDQGEEYTGLGNIGHGVKHDKQRGEPQLKEQVTGGRDTATEEIHEHDDRTLSGSGEDDDEEEDEEAGEEDEEDDTDVGGEDVADKEKRFETAQRRQEDVESGVESSRGMRENYRGFGGQRGSWSRTSRDRNRSNMSRGRRRSSGDRRNSRGRNSRQNRSRARDYRNISGRYRSNQSRSNKRPGSRDIRRNSRKQSSRDIRRSGRRSSGGNSKRHSRNRNRHRDSYGEQFGARSWRETRQELPGRRTTFDSKEMALRHRQRIEGHRFETTLDSKEMALRHRQRMDQRVTGQEEVAQYYNTL